METLYRIKYSYRTGDSFHSEDCVSTLEFEWRDLEKAKEALKRIKEHYAWYESKENYYGRKKELEKPAWHNVNSEHVQLSGEHYLINIEMDNGNEVQFWAPWCGYFEHLYGAEIVVDGEADDGMSFGEMIYY